MSKLDELIQELCPNGVEYKKLNQIAEMKRGTSITKKDVIEGDIPVISGGREPAYYCDKYNRRGETITVAGSGAGAGYVQYWTKPIFVCDAFSIKGLDGIATKFLYYYLSNIQEKVYATRKGGGVPHVHISSIENFIIPVPPMEVQREIVRILDNFTELSAELSARKKQYEYYSNELIEKASIIEQLTIGECTNVNVGSKPNEIFEEVCEYEYINAGTTNSGYTNICNCEGDTITTPSRGQGGIGFVGYQAKSFWLGPLCYRIKSKLPKKLITKYLFYYLQANNNLILSLKKEGGIPAINRTDLVNLQIPLPTIDEQERIVSILDRFDALCNDISIGLPAEIEARQKQYEYYRDKLLTFKERS